MKGVEVVREEVLEEIKQLDFVKVAEYPFGYEIVLESPVKIEQILPILQKLKDAYPTAEIVANPYGEIVISIILR